MKILDTTIEGVCIVETSQLNDLRGFFARLFCERELSQVLGDRRIVQINYSCTDCVGAIRGMHYQLPPHSEMKLVRCIKGRVWDVVVDLRAGSPTFLKWHAEELSAQNMRMMVVPEGCAHGFQALASNSELLYLHTACYEKTAEAGIRFDDPVLAISWPQTVTDLSQRDTKHSLLTETFAGINL